MVITNPRHNQLRVVYSVFKENYLIDYHVGQTSTYIDPDSREKITERCRFEHLNGSIIREVETDTNIITIRSFMTSDNEITVEQMYNYGTKYVAYWTRESD